MTSFFMMGAEERVGSENHLMKLSSLIDWNQFKPLLKGLHKNEENPQGGQIPYDPVKMFKAILLRQWHNLSDPKLEESLRVRLDFMLFTGFELGSDVPDETTLCRFRNKLIKQQLESKLFQEMNRQLRQLGLQIEKAQGAIVDATVIESAARPKRVLELVEDREEPSDSEGIVVEEATVVKADCRVEESKDPDARWLKKGKRCYFGYKGFIRTTEGQGFIQEVLVTSANESEGKQLPALIESFTGESLYADKAYASKAHDELLKSKKSKNRIMRKAVRGKALTHWEKRWNRLISKRRYIVEQAFGTLKRKFHCHRAQYLTKTKVQAQLYWKAMCFNLLKAVNLMGVTE